MTSQVASPQGVAPVPAAVEFRFTQSESFVDILRRLGSSLLVSTYQANKLLVARAAGGGLSLLVRTFERPMGLAVAPGRLNVGTRNQVWEFRDAPDIAPQVEPAGTHDACYLPRQCHLTGDIYIHEMAWIADELWLVNTRFSCLCTLTPEYSFVPQWRPPFISALAAEDRCHLNGLCAVDGKPRFVTALGATNAAGAWRAGKSTGGVVIDVPSGETIARGLSMPHSPRWHAGRLWVLESGTGRLLTLDAGGRSEVVAEVPGFARGLTFAEGYAFVGMSKIRPTSAMDGVPLAGRRNELTCGVAVINLASGRVDGLLDFHTAVEEVFDVQMLPGVRFPEVFGFQKDDLNHAFVVPPGAASC